jgi:hypothetical protein
MPFLCGSKPRRQSIRPSNCPLRVFPRKKGARAAVNTRGLYHKATPYKIIPTGQKASATSLLTFGTSLYGNIRGGDVQGSTGYRKYTSADLTAKATPRVPRQIPWAGTPRTSCPDHCLTVVSPNFNYPKRLLIPTGPYTTVETLEGIEHFEDFHSTNILWCLLNPFKVTNEIRWASLCPLCIWCVSLDADFKLLFTFSARMMLRYLVHLYLFTQNLWIYRFCPSSGILNNLKM